MRIIGLERMRFHARIGFHPEEKILGNEIEVTIYITLDSQKLTQDVIEQTLDYDEVYEKIKLIMLEQMNLLETACNKIQIAVASLSEDVKRIKVRVAKLQPPMGARIENVFVEEEWIR